MSTLMNTYGDRPLTLTKGQGSYVWDDQGRRYLDAITGIAVCGFGHAHPKLAQAISEQAESLIHTSNLYNIPAQQQLADQLIERSGMDKAFFCNSGAEANEGLLKIARKYGQEKGITTPQILVCDQSFHGRTLATLSATGNPKVHEGFGPLVEGFVRVPFDNIDAIKQAATDNPNIVAMMVEPIQGEGGVHVPADNYLNEVRELCDQHDWLMMLDEIQTGVGRTGAFYSFQLNGIKPDVLSSAKGLGNGFPIGAVLARGKAADILQPGNHGTTFGGNPLACRAALAVLELLDEAAQQRIINISDAIVTGFKNKLADCAHIHNIRAKGLMIGIELTKPCAELIGQARDKGILINVTAGNTVRLLPSFIMDQDDIDFLVNTLSELITNF